MWKANKHTCDGDCRYLKLVDGPWKKIWRAGERRWRGSRAGTWALIKLCAILKIEEAEPIWKHRNVDSQNLTVLPGLYVAKIQVNGVRELALWHIGSLRGQGLPCMQPWTLEAYGQRVSVLESNNPRSINLNAKKTVYVLKNENMSKIYIIFISNKNYLKNLSRAWQINQKSGSIRLYEILVHVPPTNHVLPKQTVRKYTAPLRNNSAST